jgi:phosphatidylglycerol---prolipoprotein diacylglyceryl transferase
LVAVPTLGLEVPAYALAIALAAAAGNLIGPWWGNRLTGLDAARLRLALVALLPFTLVGGQLHYVVNHWPMFSYRPLDALMFWRTGLHATGAIAGAIAGAPLVLRVLRLPLARSADALMPTIGVGIAIGRLGCFFNGCCRGLPCQGWWCLEFPGHPGSVHPLQLYFAASAVVIALVTAWLVRRETRDGTAALLGLFLFFLSAALLEPLRQGGPLRPYWGSHPQLQCIAAAFALFSFVALLGLHWPRLRRYVESRLGGIALSKQRS